MQCPDDNELARYIEGTLAGAAHDRFVAHIERCNACRRLAFALASESGGGGGSAAPARLVPGDRVARFEITGAVGRGGMGVVYEARDPILERTVALKLINPALATVLRPDLPERLLREARALARLSHPNVVSVFEAGEHRGAVYIAMELVAGAPLTEWLRGRRRSRVVAAMAAAARGLEAVHARGLVHRDFKPHNVMVGEDGQVKVIDFGLARAALDGTFDDESADGERPAAPGTLDGVTASGALVGTPAYSAPEQLAGKQVTQASDVYSFCATLHEALTGERPHSARSLEALLAAANAGPPAATARLPRAIREAVARGLDPDPAGRPTSGELATVLERYSTRGRRRRALLAAGAAIVVAASIWRLAPGSTADACAGVGAELDQIWSPQRRAEVAAAIAPTRDAAAVLAVIDEQAAQWRETRRQACQAAHVHGDESPALSDRRRACLGDRARELARAIGVLASSAPLPAERALAIMTGLRPASLCEATGALPSIAAPSEVTAARRRAAVDAVARGEALLVAGHPGRALGLARDAFARARRGEQDDLAARALRLAGHALGELGDPVGQRQHYERALVEAARASDRLLQALVLTDLAMGRSGEDAATHYRHADALLDGLALPALVEAEARATLVEHLRTAGHIDEASAQLERATTLAAATDDRAPFREQWLRGQLAYARASLRRTALDEPAAIAALDDAARIFAAVGATGRQVWALAALADSYEHLGQRQDAIRILARTAELRSELPGPLHAAARRIELARIEEAPGRRSALLTAAILDADRSGDYHTRVQARMHLAAALVATGDDPGAERYLVEAVQLAVDAHGESPAIVKPVTALADYYARTRQNAALLAEADRLVRATAEAGPGTWSWAWARLTLAVARAEAGQHRDALTVLAELDEHLDGATAPLRPYVQAERARCELALAIEPDRARRRAIAALAAIETAGDAAYAQAARTGWLAGEEHRP